MNSYEVTLVIPFDDVADPFEAVDRFAFRIATTGIYALAVEVRDVKTDETVFVMEDETLSQEELEHYLEQHFPNGEADGSPDGSLEGGTDVMDEPDSDTQSE